MKKLLIAVAVLIIVALAILMIPQPITPEEVSTTEVTADESAILEDMYIEMLNEEMDKLLIEQTEFNSEVEDSIASDISQFYYE